MLKSDPAIQILENKRKIILLKFTYELIKNSSKDEEDVIRLKKLLDKKGDLKLKDLEKEKEAQESLMKNLVSEKKSESQEMKESIKEKLSQIKPIASLPPPKPKPQPKLQKKVSEEQKVSGEDPIIPFTPIKPRVREIDDAELEKRKMEYLHSLGRALRIPEPKLPPQFQHLKPTPTSEKIDLGKLNPLIHDPLVKIVECMGANQKIIVSGGMGRRPTNIKLTSMEIDGIIEKFSNISKIPLEKGLFRAVVGRLMLSAITSEVISSKFVIKKIPPKPQENEVQNN